MFKSTHMALGTVWKIDRRVIETDNHRILIDNRLQCERSTGHQYCIVITTNSCIGAPRVTSRQVNAHTVLEGFKRARHRLNLALFNEL